MNTQMTAIEMIGTVDDNRQIHLDQSLSIPPDTRVHLIIMYPVFDAIPETEWYRAAAQNPVFASLHDAAEDIYALTDGEPFDDNEK